MGEEGGSSGGKNLPNAVAHGALMVTAAWGLQLSKEKLFLGGAMGLYTLKGLFGLINSSGMVDNDSLKKIGGLVDRIATGMGPAMVATEVSLDCCLSPAHIAEFFLAPFVHFVLSEVMTSDTQVSEHLLDISQGFALGSACACVQHGCKSLKLMIYLQAFLASAFLRSPDLKPEYSAAILAVACYFTWATYAGKLPF